MKATQIVAWLALVAAGSAGGAGAPGFPDLNGDHVVDAADAQAFFDAVAIPGAGSSNGSSPSITLSPATADLDHDGKVGLSDALLFGRYIDGLHADSSHALAPIPFRNPADVEAFRNYPADLKSKSAWTPATLAARYPIAFGADPAYPAGSIQYESNVADLLYGSGTSQNKSDFLGKVHAQGIAVANRTYDNYFTALDAIHDADLPLLFTTDALLHSVYLSYDSILVELENNIFIPSLNGILLGSLDYAKRNYQSGDPALDVQDQLTTALLLLDRGRGDVEHTPSADANLALVDAQQMAGMKVYGTDTSIDFSQFKPRGHYTQSAKLKAYFQAMMWLSRADLAFDLRRKTPAGKSFARTKQGALILWDCLVNSGTYADWIKMNAYIEYMVGQSDGLNAKGMGLVVEAMRIKKLPDALAAFNEARFDSALAATGLGVQAILSQSKSYDSVGQPLGLSPVFSFMPQRFILDSYTFSQVVFPLTAGLMPSGLHAAFALGDNSVLQDTAFSGTHVPGALGAQRTLYDAISPEGWQSNLYMSWLGFLRKLNGAEGNTHVSPVFRTRAWREKMRNTQLASWAQLRHNTILYAKQSYTGGIICTFPKAYVEPYPDFFAAVAAYAHNGGNLFGTARPQVADYFAKLEEISGKLADIARNTAQGLSPTDAQSEWLKTALVGHPPAVPMCGAVKTFDGWYFDLLYRRPMDVATRQDWTIADVHTHPKDEAGPDMVLEAGTGGIHLAAVAVQEDSCVTMYVGPVSSYYEIMHTGDLNRMNDDEWLKSFQETATRPSQPAWTKIYLGP